VDQAATSSASGDNELLSRPSSSYRDLASAGFLWFRVLGFGSSDHSKTALIVLTEKKCSSNHFHTGRKRREGSRNGN
jgi:hypothetical protein